jgi:hypothetical protein
LRSVANLAGIENDENGESTRRMVMNTVVSDRDPRQHPAQAPAPWKCPFYNTGAAQCEAVLPHRTPSWVVRAATCGGGDYEDCTTFLARLLNRPLARTR